MKIEIRVPDLGDLLTRATLSRWLKVPGDVIEGDDPIILLETEAFSVEIPSQEDGILCEIVAQEGDTVEVNTLLGYLQPQSIK